MRGAERGRETAEASMKGPAPSMLGNNHRSPRPRMALICPPYNGSLEGGPATIDGQLGVKVCNQIPNAQ